MAGDANEYRCYADAGLGGISSVVATLPAGANLGEARVVNGVKYRLVCNASTSAQQIPGLVLSPLAAGATGAYSVGTGASALHAHIGAVIVVHATVPTANYFWGAVSGSGLKVIGDNTSVPTGSGFYISANGAVTLMPGSVITGNVVIGINNGSAASKTITTGAASGDCLIFLD